MLKRLSDREKLLLLAAEWERTLALAWLDAINEIASSVALRSLVAELERGNIDAAMRMLNLDAERFARFEGAIIQAWNAGGIAVVDSMPRIMDPRGNRVVFSWGVRNTPAEQVLRRHAATLVDGLTIEARDIVRQTLTDGLARGQNPRQTALRLIGVSKGRTGLREGGVIGLSRPQAATLDKIFVGLRSGDAQVMRDYLGYALRDKRFDGHVRRALAEGGSVPADAVDRIVITYSNRAIRHRAENLALTETNIALEKAKTDAFQQQIDAGKLDAEDVQVTWIASVSKERREDHLAMVGKSVPFGQMFTLPDGTQCTGPHDPNLPAKHLVNCKCMAEHAIDFTAQALRRYRERVGG